MLFRVINSKMSCITSLFILASACGRSEDNYESKQLLTQSPRYFCPTGFMFDETNQQCLNQTFALGPFTNDMIAECNNNSSNNNNTKYNPALCQNNLWEKTFAAQLRGTADCPEGTENSQGLCLDSNYAYGPFLVKLIEACHLQHGGETCHEMRWPKALALASLANIPNESTPSASSTPFSEQAITAAQLTILPSAISISFPFAGPADADYITPPRSFGAPRAGGRRHAGCDLYAPAGRAIYAVKDGVVVDYYPFYDGTDAMVVNHGSFVVRYGEVGKKARNVIVGTRVKRGQIIAYVGRLQSLNQHMLHFEKFSGKGTGALTVPTNPPYLRRWDLQNPTAALKAWPYPQ